MTKLGWMNGEYLHAMDPEEFYTNAEPYLKDCLKEGLDLKKIAAMVQSRIQLYAEIPEQVDFLNEVPEYDVSMYTHKKSKSTSETSLTILKETIPLLEALESFDNDSLFAALSSYASEKGYKINTVMWPLRTAVSGKQATPAGETGIMELLGKEETLRRMRSAVLKLEP